VGVSIPELLGVRHVQPLPAAELHRLATNDALARLLGPITLSRDGDKLVAEMRGNLPALLEVSEELYNRGAGSPVRLFPTSLLLPLVARMVS
jgi:hypothetical protein